MFKKDDYIVLTKGNTSHGIKLDTVYKQRESLPYIRIYLNSNGAVDGWHTHTYNKSNNNDWRYATKEEIAEYDRMGRPVKALQVEIEEDAKNFVKLKDGGIYKINSNYILKFNSTKVNCININIFDKSYNLKGDVTHLHISNYEYPTKEEVVWLNTCIELNAYISKEDALERVNKPINSTPKTTVFKVGDWVTTLPIGRSLDSKLLGGGHTFCISKLNSDGCEDWVLGYKQPDNAGTVISGIWSSDLRLATTEEIRKVEKETTWYGAIERKTSNDWLDDSFTYLEGLNKPKERLATAKEIKEANNLTSWFDDQQSSDTINGYLNNLGSFFKAKQAVEEAKNNSLADFVRKMEKVQRIKYIGGVDPIYYTFKQDTPFLISYDEQDALIDPFVKPIKTIKIELE